MHSYTILIILISLDSSGNQDLRTKEQQFLRFEIVTKHHYFRIKKSKKSFFEALNRLDDRLTFSPF